MSVIEFNKIAGAVLLALFVSKVSDLAGESVGQPESLRKPVYVTGEMQTQAEAEAPAEGKAKPSVDVPPIEPLLANADVEAGKAAARKCTTCHSFEKGGPTKVGPPLWGIVGDQKAAGDFQYSGALKELGGTWDFESLNAFLADPRGYAPGTKMLFPGVKSDSDRAALIAYLRTLSDNPVPLP